MPKLPPNNQWTQPNVSDKFGSIQYSKNLNFDEQGYMKLSPRTTKFMDEAEDGNFGVPTAIGRQADGKLLISTTSNADFTSTISGIARTFTEDTGTNSPTGTPDTHGVYFNNQWHSSTDTTVVKKELTEGGATAWDAASITGLTSGKRHYMCVNDSAVELCVSDGNLVKSYSTAYALSVTLTISANYEITGLAYNNGRIGITTRPASSATNRKAKFYYWDGTSTSAKGYDVASDSIIAITPYKSSFSILTRHGELLFFNGGGFGQRPLAVFPHFITERINQTAISNIAFGDSMYSEGDKIYLNTSFVLNGFGRKDSRYLQGNPSGVWCYDPLVGLYHRYSPSISQAEEFAITNANINISTDVLTVSAGTVPATGNPAIYTFEDGDVIGGLKLNNQYFINKQSDTTFKLSTTKDNALNNITIDITSKGSSNGNNFYMYDLLDYGASFSNASAGAITSMGNTTGFYQELVFGGDYDTTALATNDSLCIVTPLLENRGYAVFPKVFSEGATDKTKKALIRFRPLREEDKIIVKVKERDVLDIPVATPTTTTTQGDWNSPRELETALDVSEAVTHISNGGKLEMEVLSGAGAGTMVQVESMTTESGVTSIVLAEDVIGASSGVSCHFILDNWENKGTITNASNDDGFAEIEIGKVNKFTMIKIEIRGFETTIEDIDWDSDIQVLGT